jgi:hypothetical protein
VVGLRGHDYRCPRWHPTSGFAEEGFSCIVCGWKRHESTFAELYDREQDECVDRASIHS